MARISIRVPPPNLRSRVGCTSSQSEYVLIGSRTASSITHFLHANGYDLSSFERALDFACGCGRTLNFVQEWVERAKLFGCDYEQDLVDWCRRNLSIRDVVVNQERPPLDFPDSHFDLIYAVSFFTHLPEEEQRIWLAEWRRVLKADGLILVSLQGEGLARRDSIEIPRHGLLYRDLGPEFNQKVSYSSREYVEREWGRYFSQIVYSEMGLNNHQDLVLLGSDLSLSRRAAEISPLQLAPELEEVFRKRNDLKRDFDENGIGYPHSYWKNLSLWDWALFDGYKEEPTLSNFSHWARYRLIEHE